MLRRKQIESLARMAACAAVSLLAQSCTPQAQIAASLYNDGQSAEAAKDLKKAEQSYVSCLSAALDGNSEEYRLAALNRLTELEKRLNNPSKAKSYMNKAATLAENVKYKDDKTPSVSLAKEQHEALVRLGDWEFEDGNYISARKLYEKATSLEPVLKIEPQSNQSAYTLISRLEARASMENAQVKKGMSKNKSTLEMRGPEFIKRSSARHKVQKDMNEALNRYRDDGSAENAAKFLQQLEKIYTIYGATEPEYRNALNYGTRAFLLHNNPEPIAPFVEKDLTRYNNFSQAALDNAVPQAVEDATSYVQDLLMLGMIRRHQGRFGEGLDFCMKAQSLAKKVIPENSRMDYELSHETAMALEHMQRFAEALPYRRRVVAMIDTYDKEHTSYADQMSSLGTDLFANGLFGDAESAFKKSIQIKRAEKNQNNYCNILHTYADTLLKLGKTKEARMILLESLPYSQKTGSFSLINNYTLLMRAYRDIDPKAAIQYGKKSLDQMRKFGTFNHEYLPADNFLKVAEIQVQNHWCNDGIKTLDEGVAWQIAHGQELSAFTAAMLNLKGAALNELGKYDEEEICRLKALDLCRRFVPPQPGPLTSTMFQTAARFQQRKKFEQAEKLYREAIVLSAKSADPSCKQIELQSKASLGVIAIIQRNDRVTAERYKAELLPVFKSRLRNVTHQDISLCLNIADLCFYLKDKENCQKLLNMAQSVYDKDPQKNPSLRERLEAHRNTYAPLLSLDKTGSWCSRCASILVFGNMPNQINSADPELS